MSIAAMTKKRRFKQRQKEQEFEISSPMQQAIQNDRTLYIDKNNVTETSEVMLEKYEELGRNLTDEESKEIFEKRMKMRVD